MGFPPSESLFLLAITWLLAKLEIEIEGPHGWAEKLPTWRFSPAWWLKFTNGKPLTGYHFYMTGLLIAFFHLPLADGWSLQGEVRAISLYLLSTIMWDFQWFAWNPAWGLKRFFVEPIWWFPVRFGPFPIEYYWTVAGSAAAVALLNRGDFKWWIVMASWVMAGTALSAIVGSRLKAHEDGS